MIIANVVNFLHILGLLIPIGIFFIPTPRKRSLLFKFYMGMFLIFLLVPIQWVILERRCILTILSQRFGDFKKEETQSAFIRKNMLWLYKPFMKAFGWKEDNEGIHKCVHLQLGVYFILIWYFIFFRMCK